MLPPRAPLFLTLFLTLFSNLPPILGALWHRGYKAAIAKYTEAIRAADGVPAVAGTAYLNRAVAEFKLGNFGRALEDAEASLRLDSSSIKARYRCVWDG